MAYTLWSQDIFTKGELSPFMYARATVNEYSNGLKTAQNVLTYPTGAAGKRFGSLYQALLNSSITSFDQIYFQTFQYLDECVYQMIFFPDKIDIYLEGILVFEVTSTGLDAQSVYNLSNTVIGAVFRITGANFHPKDLVRTDNTPNTITATSSNAFTFTGASLTSPPTVYPIIFSNVGGTLPVTSPQIKVGVTYFARSLTTTTVNVYSNSQDAKANVNFYLIINIGTGTNSIIFRNTFTLADTVFKDFPYYDFNGITTSYDAITFTPSATTGVVTVTLSGAYAPLTSAYVGGAFFGAGGAGRITAVTDTTHFTLAVQTPFDSVNAIQGSIALLAEPAWSDIRGWPTICSSYQNRALFANTVSLPNGFWASVINDYADFGDLTTDDDDAISWFPTSDNMNFIKFIVPYRSITVHTNTGIYSSPLSDIAAITPNNFTLQLQDSTPADVLLPQAIDNQILVLSGNDAHQMLWDGINNAYTSNIVSVINEQLIRNPLDETAFQDLKRAGSRYVFIVNENGSLAVFQTLLAQGVSGFTPQIMEQSYGDAQFRQVASSANGRCWFVVQRQVAAAQSGINITGFTASTLKAVASSFSTTSPTAIKFTTSGSLPTSSPQLVTTQYYWAIGTTADDFYVYTDQDDALSGDDAIVFSSAGTTSQVVPWTLTTIFTLEELTKETFLDCAIKYEGTATDTVSTGVLFNAQDIKMAGDGFGFDAKAETNISNQIVFKAHGQNVSVSEAFIGFPIKTIIEPMPLSISSGNSAKQTTLTQPKRVMFVRFMFNNTIGGTINDVPIALDNFDQAHIGEPPIPTRGVVEMAISKAWDDFKNPTYTIYHDDPFDIQLLGVFYSVEI